jgi:hypothetical protein
VKPYYQDDYATIYHGAALAAYGLGDPTIGNEPMQVALHQYA